MKNRCKHKTLVQLTPSTDNRWMWCPVCGATRLDIGIDYCVKWPGNGETEWSYKIGKWISPKMAKV